MFEIIVNNKRIRLLQPVKEVNSLIINHIQGIPIPIQPGHKNAIAEWLYNLTQQVEIVEYNHILIQSCDVNKPSHLKDK